MSTKETPTRYVVDHEDAYALADGMRGTTDDVQDVYVLASDYDALVQQIEAMREALEEIVSADTGDMRMIASAALQSVKGER